MSVCSKKTFGILKFLVSLILLSVTWQITITMALMANVTSLPSCFTESADPRTPQEFTKTSTMLPITAGLLLELMARDSIGKNRMVTFTLVSRRKSCKVARTIMHAKYCSFLAMILQIALVSWPVRIHCLLKLSFLWGTSTTFR